MNALSYLVFTRLKNSLKSLIHKPVRLIYAIVFLVLIGFTIFAGNTEEVDATQYRDIRELIAGAMALYTLMFLMLVRNGFANGGTIFAMPDVNMVFPAPFPQRKVLFYGLIKQKWFSKLQFRSLRIKPELFDDYYQDTCGITKQNMIAFLKESSMYSMKKTLGECTAKVHLFVGERENKRILFSAKKIREVIKNCDLHILPSMYHGEFSINQADRYAKELYDIIKLH